MQRKECWDGSRTRAAYPWRWPMEGKGGKWAHKKAWDDGRRPQLRGGKEESRARQKAWGCGRDPVERQPLSGSGERGDDAGAALGEAAGARGEGDRPCCPNCLLRSPWCTSTGQGPEEFPAVARRLDGAAPSAFWWVGGLREGSGEGEGAQEGRSFSRQGCTQCTGMGRGNARWYWGRGVAPGG